MNELCFRRVAACPLRQQKCSQGSIAALQGRQEDRDAAVLLLLVSQQGELLVHSQQGTAVETIDIPMKEIDRIEAHHYWQSGMAPELWQCSHGLRRS